EQNEAQIVWQAPLVAERRAVEAGGIERLGVGSMTEQNTAEPLLERGADHRNGVCTHAELLDEIAVLERSGCTPARADQMASDVEHVPHLAPRPEHPPRLPVCHVDDDRDPAPHPAKQRGTYAERGSLKGVDEVPADRPFHFSKGVDESSPTVPR